jgi:hypothetical protein
MAYANSMSKSAGRSTTDKAADHQQVDASIRVLLALGGKLMTDEISPRSNARTAHVTHAEEIAAYYASTATSHLTQALHWHRFSLGIRGDRQLSLAHCVELYAREAGRYARCARQPPELWRTRAPQAFMIPAIEAVFFAGWQECDTFIALATSKVEMVDQDDSVFDQPQEKAP